MTMVPKQTHEKTVGPPLSQPDCTLSVTDTHSHTQPTSHGAVAATLNLSERPSESLMLLRDSTSPSVEDQPSKDLDSYHA